IRPGPCGTAQHEPACGFSFRTAAPAFTLKRCSGPFGLPLEDRFMRRCQLDGLSLLLALFLVAPCLYAQNVQQSGTAPPLLDCTGEKGRTEAEVKAAQAAWARYLGRQVEEEDEIAPGVKMTFVLVPPGKFLMGSPGDEKERSNDEVQHEVTITRPFFLGKTEVTQAQYEAAGKENKS